MRKPCWPRSQPLAPDNFVFWQRDGRFWLDLPSGWRRGQQGLRIAWVDRDRRWGDPRATAYDLKRVAARG